MRLYETTFLINPQTDDSTIDSHVQSVKDVISNQGGKVILDNRMGTRRLAYEIDGLTQAYFTNLVFEAPAKALSPLERHFRLGEVYLRNLTVLFEGDLEQMIAEARESAAAAAQPRVTTETQEKEPERRREEKAPETVETPEPASSEEPKQQVETVAEPAVKGDTDPEAEEALKPSEPEGEPVPGAVETETEEVEQRVRQESEEDESTEPEEEAKPEEEQAADEDKPKPAAEGETDKEPTKEASETHYDEEEQL